MQTMGAVTGYAQNVQGSGQASNTLSVNASCNTTSTLSSLNIDMFEMNSNSTNQTPACNWGNGNDDYFWAAGFSGATCSGTYAGITVGASGSIGLGGVQKFQALPWSQSAQAGNPVNYVDVAIGVCTDLRFGVGFPLYFVLAVYESNGEIFLEHYDIVIDWTNSSYSFDVYQVATTNPPAIAYLTNNPVQLSNSSGTASRPHIDLIYDDTYPTTGGRHEVIGYVITWQQGMLGSEEVWAIEGPMSVSGQYTPAPATGGYFKIDDGKFPDITGVTAANTAVPSDPSKAYVTYLTRNGDEVHLAEWDYNSAMPPSTPAVTTHGAISATAGTDDYLYPRIAGPQYYDFTSPVANDPACVVVVTEDDGTSGYNKVNTYNYYTSGTPTIVSLVDASDQNTGNGFNSNGYHAMKPVVTGVGALVSSLYAGGGNAYDEYPTAFYSDYTYAVNNGTYAASGDFYAFGTQVIQTATPSITKSGSNYWEANQNSIDLQVTTPFDMNSNQPYMAVATTNNSGYELMFAYFDTDRMWRKYTGNTLYNFKPGKTTGMHQVENNGYAVYPSPVSRELNITQADGADYIIIDITGRTLSTGNISDNKASIDASGLAAGIYILQLSKDGHTEQVKFVKQ